MVTKDACAERPCATNTTGIADPVILEVLDELETALEEAMLGALDFDQFYRIMVAAARKRKRK